RADVDYRRANFRWPARRVAEVADVVLGEAVGRRPRRLHDGLRDEELYRRRPRERAESRCALPYHREMWASTHARMWPMRETRWLGRPERDRSWLSCGKRIIFTSRPCSLSAV